MPAPPTDVRWDDEAAMALSTEAERAAPVDVYSRAFVARLAPSPEASGLLEHLSDRCDLAILSNWPLAVTIDRYAEAAGWLPYLRAVVVSQRVGVIKPYPGIFHAAREALGGPEPVSILHVGDDWAADVVGAKGVGWRAAYLRDRPGDSPLPGSERDTTVEADAELDRLADLEAALDRLDREG
jgi:FMN phosphatase YigB (HAD superfamily)